jgi:hypothetical protein
MISAGFGPAILTNERRQTYALELKTNNLIYQKPVIIHYRYFTGYFRDTWPDGERKEGRFSPGTIRFGYSNSPKAN